MRVKHCHPSFPGQESYQRELHHILTACVKGLRQEEFRPIFRVAPSEVR